jgi:hypothetical protein
MVEVRRSGVRAGGWGKSLEAIFGELDAMKSRSSAEIFRI